MINRAGFKVYCIEVEDVLASHSLVVEAAVVGVPDDVLGERVHAYIFLDGNQVDADEIKIIVLPDYPTIRFPTS
ncbi:hypothetical protein [Maritimibacter sp.]|uniref:AMP-binding enzyme n=1 Tax=Maritimibacter sp. TaxID=2003363 RepID=UPI00338EDDA5